MPNGPPGGSDSVDGPTSVAVPQPDDSRDPVGGKQGRPPAMPPFRAPVLAWPGQSRDGPPHPRPVDQRGAAVAVLDGKHAIQTLGEKQAGRPGLRGAGRAGPAHVRRDDHERTLHLLPLPAGAAHGAPGQLNHEPASVHTRAGRLPEPRQGRADQPVERVGAAAYRWVPPVSLDLAMDRRGVCRLATVAVARCPGVTAACVLTLGGGRLPSKVTLLRGSVRVGIRPWSRTPLTKADFFAALLRAPL